MMERGRFSRSEEGSLFIVKNKKIFCDRCEEEVHDGNLAYVCEMTTGSERKHYIYCSCFSSRNSKGCFNQYRSYEHTDFCVTLKKE